MLAALLSSWPLRCVLALQSPAQRPTHRDWCQAGHAAAIRALISAGADPEAEDKAGCTPMLAATVEGQAQAVAALVLGGAVRGMPDLEGLTDGVAAIDRSG